MFEHRNNWVSNWHRNWHYQWFSRYWWRCIARASFIVYFSADMHVAAGTSLAVIIPTAISGVISHSSRGSIDWRIAILIGFGAIIGASVGTWLAYGLPTDTLKKVFAVILLVVSFSILFDAYDIRFTKPSAKKTTTTNVSAARESVE